MVEILACILSYFLKGLKYLIYQKVFDTWSTFSHLFEIGVLSETVSSLIAPYFEKNYFRQAHANNIFHHFKKPMFKSQCLKLALIFAVTLCRNYALNRKKLNSFEWYEKDFFVSHQNFLKRPKVWKQFRFLRVHQTSYLIENQLHKIWYPLKSRYQVTTWYYFYLNWRERRGILRSLSSFLCNQLSCLGLRLILSLASFENSYRYFEFYETEGKLKNLLVWQGM